MKHLNKIWYLAFFTTAFVVIGCADKNEDPIVTPVENQKAINSCEGCHTSYVTLKAVYTPDPPSTGGGGCGGETPHIEPYDRVYLGGEGYTEFKNGFHGKIECTFCHNGTDGTSDKTVAHSGSFLNKPSHDAAEKCAGCHADVFERTHNSTHEQGWGQKSMVTSRMGLGTGPDKFDLLSDLMKEGYDHNCAKCHGSCGDCHVNRPKATGGGLYQGHNFSKTPDMKDICVGCHVSRGGHAYFGQGAGTSPDVHLSKAGFTCLNCHSMNEVHGDGQYYDQRYKTAQLPSCSDCHQDVATSNLYHNMHANASNPIADLNCNVCHSQEYNNCGSCHIGAEEGARIPSHQGYKIGMNPIPTIKPGIKYATLREAPMAPDSWVEFGTPVLTNFDAFPTYKYATPHNILKRTPRTADANGDLYTTCSAGCHIRNEGGVLINKELYLFESDLQPWEIEANKSTVVDGKLPSSWGL